jgi:hypothetical protein
MPAAGCASPSRLPNHEARLADPIEHIVDELDRYRAGGVDAHPVEETIHQCDRAAEELGKAAGMAAPSKNRDCRDDAFTTNRNGQTLDWWQRVASRKAR